MAKKTKLPDVLFVTKEEEGTENEYIHAEPNIENLAELGANKTVGTYKLVEVKTLKTTVHYE